MTLTGSGSSGQFRHFFRLAMFVTLVVTFQPVTCGHDLVYILRPHRVSMANVDKKCWVTRDIILTAKVRVFINIDMNYPHTLTFQPFQRRLGSLTGTTPCRTE